MAVLMQYYLCDVIECLQDLILHLEYVNYYLYVKIR
jgi:hypothetical protein